MRTSCRSRRPVRGVARGRESARAAGLTLIETLVVLTLLTLLASSLLPSLSYVLDRAGERDIEERLLGSWKTARALALARNVPAIWRIRQADERVIVSVWPLDEQSPSREYTFSRCIVGIDGGAAAMAPQCWQVIVPAHGLTDSLELRMTRDGKEIRIVLPGIIDEFTDKVATDDGA